jgi:hypothetical protein
MLKTLWTVTAAGLLALCTTGCGGGSTDYASKFCDKLKSCDPTMTAADVAACKTTANQNLSTMPDSMKSQVDKEIDACLTQACPLPQSCLDVLSTTDYASNICDKMKSCGYTTDVASCTTTASGYISQIPANSKSQADKQMDACLAMACPVFQSCIVGLEGQL